MAAKTTTTGISRKEYQSNRLTGWVVDAVVAVIFITIAISAGVLALDGLWKGVLLGGGLMILVGAFATFLRWLKKADTCHTCGHTLVDKED